MIVAPTAAIKTWPANQSYKISVNSILGISGEGVHDRCKFRQVLQVSAPVRGRFRQQSEGSGRSDQSRGDASYALPLSRPASIDRGGEGAHARESGADLSRKFLGSRQCRQPAGWN